MLQTGFCGDFAKKVFLRQSSSRDLYDALEFATSVGRISLTCRKRFDKLFCLGLLVNKTVF